MVGQLDVAIHARVPGRHRVVVLVVLIVVSVTRELVVALVVAAVVRWAHLPAGTGRGSRTLSPTTAASTTPTTTSTLRARPLALATFIRHVKTFPFGNRSHEGAESRRAQAAYRVT
jgi:hypothetical protein